MAHSRRAHGAFFNEMRLQRAMRAMALRASSAPLMRQTVHPGALAKTISSQANTQTMCVLLQKQANGVSLHHM